MIRRSGTLSRPPRALQRRGIRLDNIALVPASLLPFKAEWRRLTETLPAREAVFVVPEGETPLRLAMRRIMPQLRARGRHITTLSAKQFG